MRKFYWFISKSEFKTNGKKSRPRFHLYIQARPMFSIIEMLAKERKIFENIEKIPINERFLLDMSAQISEEPDRELELILPSTTDIAHMHLDVDKCKKRMKFYYENYMEFVDYKKRNLKIFLEWLMGFWGGEWIVGHPEVSRYNYAEFILPKKKK